MTTHFATYEFASPAAGYEHAPSLPLAVSEDGKSLENPQTGVLSEAYERFIDPLNKGREGGFDVHVYYMASQMEYARQLYDRIRREFPELRIYKFWEQPVGPHPYPMFEVNLFSPAQFGAFVPWLSVWRGPLSVLVHPNTVVEGLKWDSIIQDHTQRAMWMGERVPLDLSMMYELRRKELEASRQSGSL
ncbi:DOPA-like domain-containing protein [Coniella lustricola]|uniref:DOPA-like domain-containing protein n=1 Tax=Coniella lustricola TaxID=2025994 RepID=A0A2T2ZZ72_9PEZI|nr:DOPA-like domain-containing protein [Coniella lustricola]